MTAEEARGELLLVDDSLASLAYLSALLTGAGYVVREAPSGELALRTVKARPPELILLDVRMPDLDGFTVCRRLKADEASRGIPVIFLSAQDETTDKILGLQVGAVDFVGKNFDHEEVFARIDTHIALARTKKALEQERANLEARVRERTRELAQGQAMLRTIIDSGPDWIYATDRDHKCLLVNDSMARALGYPCADAMPCAGCERDQADPLGHWNNEEREVLAGKTIYKASETVPLADGRQLTFEVYRTPLRDEHGDIYGVLCHRRDISQRMRIEEENRMLERSLWQAKKMEAIGQLTGGIAHDFNHLLSLILGFTQFAQTAVANGRPEKLESYLAEIMKAGTEGQAVVAQLLAFSRTEEPARAAIDVGTIVAETIDSLRQALAANISLSLDAGAGLPHAFIRDIHVRQALTNLILNARDSLVAGGDITVRCRHEPQAPVCTCASCRKPFHGSYLTLSVEDSGPGIPEGILENIFDPFFTTKDVGKGAGLGLSMVHGVIHSAGGHVTVDSPAAGGARFRLWIPVAQ